MLPKQTATWFVKQQQVGLEFQRRTAAVYLVTLAIELAMIFAFCWTWMARGLSLSLGIVAVALYVAILFTRNWIIVAIKARYKERIAAIDVAYRGVEPPEHSPLDAK